MGKATFTIKGANGKDKGGKREALKSRRKETRKALKVKQCRDQPWIILQ